MSDVQETLQELMHRRLRELGVRRGRGEPLSLREAYQAVPLGPDGKPLISYETARLAFNGEHTRIGDRAADAFAVILDVGVSDVLIAAGQRPRLGPFRLPTRADRLDDKQRKVVLAVVDAILSAADESDRLAPTDVIAEAMEEGDKAARPRNSENVQKVRRGSA